MNKLRIIAMVMLLIAVIFVFFALGHPEMSFPWGNGVSYAIYLGYFATMISMFVVSLKKR